MKFLLNKQYQVIASDQDDPQTQLITVVWNDDMLIPEKVEEMRHALQDAVSAGRQLAETECRQKYLGVK